MRLLLSTPLLLLWLHSCVARYHDYIIIGAGPAGLQMGYFMKKANRDHVILEKANVSGAFFTTYPLHDRIISINKRNTGQTNKEFNWRHDWNSLMSDKEELQMRHYSKVMFPDRRDLVKYLNDYEQKLGLNVQHNTDIRNVRRVFNSTGGFHLFHMEDQEGTTYTCKYLIVATGMGKANNPEFPGMEHSEAYEDISTDPMDYEGQSVLILGRGNTAFEVADSILGNTNLIHMIGRSRVRLSWATHYVGDLRAINNGLLDTYQLKSLDAVLEAPIEEVRLVKTDDGKLKLELLNDERINAEGDLGDNFPMRDSYDRVIRCLGWTFDDDLFENSTMPNRGKGRKGKFPKITPDYQSSAVENMYFAGTNAHSMDFRKSAGGFIHGFRYTARALHRILEQRNHGLTWPSTTLSLEELLPYTIRRLNEMSGPYQMFGMLCDVIAIRKGGTEFEYFEEFPVNLMHEFSVTTGAPSQQIIAIVLEYGKDFSGPGKDVFRVDRAGTDRDQLAPAEAHNSNFLHPVFYYFKSPPSAAQMGSRTKVDILPRPDRLHHILEDFLSMWDAPISHVLPLRRFIEDVLQSDMKQYFGEECFRLSLTHANLPRSCELYLEGQGIMGADHMLMNQLPVGMINS